MFISIGVAFLWGLMEGLWFFIIPDVWLSIVATKGFKHAIYSTLAAAFGAFLAVIAFHGIEAIFANQDVALAGFKWFWSKFPGYYESMFVPARQDLLKFGAHGFTYGPPRGIPYRFYILESSKQHLPLLSVLFWAPLARLERIIIAPIIVLVLRRFITKGDAKMDRYLRYFLIFAWICIYILYWGFFLPKEYGSVI